MLWQIEFDERLKISLKRSNPSPVQKEYLMKAIVNIESLEDPFAHGGNYHGHWAYKFGKDSLVHCHIDQKSGTIRIFDVTF